MKLKEIENILPDLDWVSSIDPDYSVRTISNIREPIDSTIVFVGTTKLYQSLLDNREKKKLGIILSEDLFSKKEKHFFLKDSWDFVGKVENINHSMSILSKPFYDQWKKKHQDLVDARKLGDVDIHPTAQISEHVFIGSHVRIDEGAIIYSGCKILSGSHIGKDTILFPNVTIYPETIIGQRCRIHSQSAIGADGFGYNFFDGSHQKVWHQGGVIIGDDVEIGANSSVDMGTFSPTRIGDGTKIDNQVQIGHNCIIGKGVIICGQAGTSGSAEVGDFTVIGGKAGIGPGVVIGSACQIAGSAMVTSNLEAKSVVAGHPARAYKEWMKGVAYLRKASLNK